MRYRVITVAREFGSAGEDIARALAAKLGWRLLDNALVLQIAQAAHVDPEMAMQYDERVDSWVHRVSRHAIWSGAFEAVAEPVDASLLDAERTAALATELIKQAHREGNCVIVGRGGQCALRKQDDVFHVFVYSPLKTRAERSKDSDEAHAKAEERIKEMDLMRAQYVKHYFGCDWANPHLYQLLIDSSIGQERAVESILAAMGAREAGN